MKINVRISGIVIKNGKLLVVRQENKTNGTYFLLPGGGLEHDETIEACVVREVKEETGLDVKAGQLAYYEDVVSKDDHTLHLIFRCTLIGGNISVADPKVKEVSFVDKKEFKTIAFFPKKLQKRLFDDDKVTSISLGKTPYP